MIRGLIRSTQARRCRITGFPEAATSARRGMTGLVRNGAREEQGYPVWMSTTPWFLRRFRYSVSH